jgi:hypothetical protein
MAYCQYYDAPSGREFCLSFGVATAQRRIMIIPPLFDEMNRMRRVIVSAMRHLERFGIASFLPDLPGCNESIADLTTHSLSTWKLAMASAANRGNSTHIASLRGGALIDETHSDLPHWRFVPAKSETLLKAMLRTRVAGDKEAGLITTSASLLKQAEHSPIELGGNWLGPQMIAELSVTEAEQLHDLRVVTLGDGPNAVTGSALWLRAEPQDDANFAVAIADDLAQWTLHRTAQCAR